MLAAIAAFASDASEDSFVELDVPTYQWVIFLGIVTFLILFDLLVLHREPKVLPFRRAALESSVWVTIGLGFGAMVGSWHGAQAAGEYLSGYLIELSLSVDNVFVWAVILTFFAVPRQFQHRVLFWGIFGALVLRAVFIFAGVALIETFEWVLYVFGAFLVFTGWRIAHHDETEEVDYSNNLALRVVRRVIPSTNEYDGQKLFTRVDAKRLATPLFAVLVLIEVTDVVFAVDSVPAILAVSREQFIVLSSNAFAILGLRSLYFLLAGMAGKFRYLNLGLGVILAYVGVKMLLVGEPVEWHPPTWLSLAVIAVVITVAIVASLVADAREHDADDSVEHELAEAEADDPQPR